MVALFTQYRNGQLNTGRGLSIDKTGLYIPLLLGTLYGGCLCVQSSIMIGRPCLRWKCSREQFSINPSVISHPPWTLVFWVVVWYNLYQSVIRPEHQ